MRRGREPASSIDERVEKQKRGAGNSQIIDKMD